MISGFGGKLYQIIFRFKIVVNLLHVKIVPLEFWSANVGTKFLWETTMLDISIYHG